MGNAESYWDLRDWPRVKTLGCNVNSDRLPGPIGVIGVPLNYFSHLPVCMSSPYDLDPWSTDDSGKRNEFIELCARRRRCRVSRGRSHCSQTSKRSQPCPAPACITPMKSSKWGLELSIPGMLSKLLLLLRPLLRSSTQPSILRLHPRITPNRMPSIEESLGIIPTLDGQKLPMIPPIRIPLPLQINSIRLIQIRAPLRRHRPHNGHQHPRQPRLVAPQVRERQCIAARQDHPHQQHGVAPRGEHGVVVPGSGRRGG